MWHLNLAQLDLHRSHCWAVRSISTLGALAFSLVTQCVAVVYRCSTCSLASSWSWTTRASSNAGATNVIRPMGIGSQARGLCVSPRPASPRLALLRLASPCLALPCLALPCLAPLVTPAWSQVSQTCSHRNVCTDTFLQTRSCTHVLADTFSLTYSRRHALSNTFSYFFFVWSQWSHVCTLTNEKWNSLRNCTWPSTFIDNDQ